MWTEKNKDYKFRSYDLEHYGTKMRWIVFYSQHAHDRTIKTFTATLKKQEAQLKKDLSRLQTQQFSCSDDARKALTAIEKKYVFYQVKKIRIDSIERHSKVGRPVPGAKKSVHAYQVEATFEIIQSKVNSEIEHRSCFVLATNIPEKDLPAANVIDDYKGQDHVEKCFEFMKAPSFFAASFFVKSVKRIQAMLVVMTLALLVYTVAQRRFRKWLMDNKKTIPNQIKKPVARPTLRWAFMCLEGIYTVTVFSVDGKMQSVIKGLNDLRILILSCFGEAVMKLYDIERYFDPTTG